jgi:hypothetical protein
MNNLTRDEMLKALTKSGNENVAEVCTKIINKQIDVERYERGAGSFMKAVLAGDYYWALTKADGLNRACLENAFILKFAKKYSK